MISFFVGLAIVLVMGGAVTKHIQNNPTTATQWRQAKRAAKTSTKGKGKPYDGPSRSWIVAKATGQVLSSAGVRAARAGGRAVNLVRTRESRRMAKVKAAHAAAKERGETAATSAGGVHVDRRGWRGAFEDLREAVRPRPSPEETGPPAGAGPQQADEPPASAPEAPPGATTPKPLDVRSDITCNTCGRTHTVTLRAGDSETVARCPCGAEIHMVRKMSGRPDETPPTSTPTETPAPSAAPANAKEATPMTATMPTYATLFEMSDALARQPFEHIEQVHAFIKELRFGTNRVGNMYRGLALRMSDRMNIDPIVTEPLMRCGEMQQVIAELVDVADVEMGRLLETSLDELLVSGAQLPHHELLNGPSSTSGAVLVPQFFETAQNLAGRAFVDLRDLHCLLKALKEASQGQESHYWVVADKLTERDLYAGHFQRAARIQNGITIALDDADTNMGRLLSMTVREIASSHVKAPNVRMLND